MRANTATATTSTATTGYLITNTLTDTRTQNKKLSDVLAHACRDVNNNTTCNPATLSEYDLIEWTVTIANALPMGRACIASPDNSVFTLYITWDDNRSGTVTTDANPSACTTITTYSNTETNPDPVLSISVQL